MTKENIGIFRGDSENSSLFAVYSLDFHEALELPLVLSTVGKCLFEEGLITSGDYIHYGDEESVRRDTYFESEDSYDVTPEELTGQTPRLVFEQAANPDYKELVFDLIWAYCDNFGEVFTLTFAAQVHDHVLQAFASELDRNNANLGVSKGTAVYLQKPDYRTIPLKTVSFDPSYHDARTVLPASKVPAKASQELEIHPMPPGKSEYDPKYWGFFKGTSAKKIHFTGRTHRDIKLKVAVYEAWENFFEVK